MAFTKATLTGAKDTIKQGWTKFNNLIDDLLSTTSGLGASQIGVEDAAGNLDAVNVETAIAEIYTDHSSTRVLAEIFDENSATTTGLTWGYKGGKIRVDNTVTTVAAGTLVLTDDDVNYIEITQAGVVSKNTTGFTSGNIPIRQVTCASGVQTVSTDKRAWFVQTAAATATSQGTVELATDAETATGTDTERATTPANIASMKASDAEAIAGTATDKLITPANLSARTATDARTGVVELATDAEVTTGTDTARAVTPAGLQQKTASATAKGIVELATDAETATGTDTERATTPANVASLKATDAQAVTGTATDKITTPANLPFAVAAYQKHLRHLIYPVAGNYNPLYMAGEKPFWFNQQGKGFGWGGEYPNGAGDMAWFETGYIEDNSNVGLGAAANGTWSAQGFKLGQACTINAVWLKMYKTGNPQKDNEPLVVYVCPDSGGDPDEASPVITFTTINGHSMASAAENWPITSNTDGAWYKFAGDSAALSANTQYYIVTKTTGADAVNYFNFKRVDLTNRYSHGAYWGADDAIPSTWTEYPTYGFTFLIETLEATQLLQSGGEFDGKLVFNEGLPKNLGQFLRNDLKNFYDNEGVFTWRGVLQTIPASSTLLDITMGDLGANRVRLYTDATPNVCLEVYESDGTKHAITDGATDVTAGTFDVMFSVRHEGDGADFLKLLVNGAAEGTQLATQTIDLDANFADLASVITGGGWEAEPTWDKDFKTDQLAGGNLPSNDADTAFTTTTAATEASCFSVQNSKLYQNEAYYAIGNENGYYKTDMASFVDATGFTTITKVQINKCVNTSGELAAVVTLDGSVNYIRVFLHEYYLESNDFKHQADLMSKPNIVQVVCKGDDYWHFFNGKLVIDGTGKFDDASGSTEVNWGDSDTTAGSEADVVWHEMLVYDAGPLLPSAADGMILHESAFWSADMTDIAALLYNSGTFKSVKELCGLDKNYVERVYASEKRRSITAPTNTGTDALLAEMECFALVPNTKLKMGFTGYLFQDTDQKYARTYFHIDGASTFTSGYAYEELIVITEAATANANMAHTSSLQREFLCGLHKIEVWWKSEDATSTAYARNLTIEEK
ncbi:hypothetical protein ACFL3R_00620 [Thermodesulfobacteriota bacterium]